MGKDVRDTRGLMDDDSSSGEEGPTGLARVCDGIIDFVHQRPTMMLAVLFWALGVLLVMVFSNYGPLEACYFVTQIVTTIGYGDMTPKTDTLRLIVAFYVLLMLIVASFALNALVSNVLEKDAGIVAARLESLERLANGLRGEPSGTQSSQMLGMLERLDGLNPIKTMGAAEQRQLAGSSALFVFFVAFGVLYYHFEERCSCSYGITAIAGCTDEEACEAGQSKTFATSFYMSVVTLTTVGFGDFTPQTVLGRVIGIPWMIFGVGATAFFLSSLQEALLVKKVTEKERVKSMTQQSFSLADKDHSGGLSRYEFISYMLLQEGLVEQEALERLERIFMTLDYEKTNHVSWQMIEKFQEKAAMTG